MARAKIGHIEARGVAESSGIVASLKYPGVFWTHNDQGNPAEIFAITREGKPLGRFKIEAKNDDWEDIATDDAGNLYVGNIGDNEEGRKSVEVYRVKEPDPKSAGGGALAVEKTWRLVYPERAVDAESLFVQGGYGYVITKVTKKREATMYRFPLEGGEEAIDLEEVTELPTTSPVASASLSADGKRLAVVSQKGLCIFDVEGDVASAGEAPMRYIPFDGGHNIEGCTWVPEGVLLSSETRELFLFKQDEFPAPSDEVVQAKPKKGKKR